MAAALILAAFLLVVAASALTLIAIHLAWRRDWLACGTAALLAACAIVLIINLSTKIDSAYGEITGER